MLCPESGRLTPSTQTFFMEKYDLYNLAQSKSARSRLSSSLKSAGSSRTLSSSTRGDAEGLYPPSKRLLPTAYAIETSSQPTTFGHLLLLSSQHHLNIKFSVPSTGVISCSSIRRITRAQVDATPVLHRLATFTGTNGVKISTRDWIGNHSSFPCIVSIGCPLYSTRAYRLSVAASVCLSWEISINLGLEWTS